MATPAMGLTLPVVGVTPGATAGTNIVDNFTIIDTHDHSSGKGVQIPTAGLNINAALSFGNQKAYNLLCTQFTSQTSSPTSAGDRPNVHVLNGNLYFVNSSGTAIQITNGSSIAGTAGSISGFTANTAAVFNSSLDAFQWFADSSNQRRAKQDTTDILLYPNVNNPTARAVLKVNSTVTNYDFTLPDAPPGSDQALIMNLGGEVSTVSYDTIGSGMTSIGANSIAAARTRPTGTSVAQGGIAISNGSGAFVTASTTAVDVTNLTVTITTSGRPVQLTLITEDDTNESNFGINRTSSNLARGYMRFIRGTTIIARHDLAMNIDTSATENLISISYPPSAAAHIDTPSAGTHTYKISVLNQNASSQFFVNNVKLVAYEL